MLNKEIPKIKIESVFDRYTKKQKECCWLANQLLKKLNDKQLTLEDFEKEIAYWYITDFLEQCYYKPLPTKPEAVKEFEQKHKSWKSEARKKGRDFDEDLFLETQMKREVEYYYEEKDRIRNINASNYYWLKDLKKVISGEDVVSHQKLDIKINEFRQKLEEEELIDL